MTKMTDADLSEARRALHAGDSSEADWASTWGDVVFAHIETLTAERDEWTRQSSEDRSLALGVAGERDALRERVTALEAEVEAARATLEDEHAAHAETLERMRSAESRLAAIRQRALAFGEMTMKDVVSGEWTRQAVHFVNDIIGTSSALMSNPSPPSEPTTAEAFATVRKQVHASRGAIRLMEHHGHESDGSVEQGATDALAALSLLERRRGAQDAALRKAMAEIRAEDGDPWMTLKSALTDAPEVYTREEVAIALAPWTERGLRVSDVLERLTALRRTP